MSVHVQESSTLYPNNICAVSGTYRVRTRTPGGHPADGMTIDVSVGDGAVVSIINPQSFVNGGPEWVSRYGDIEAIRYCIAGFLESYDYLLSSEITTKEAIRRLRIMRAVRELAAKETPDAT